MNNSPGGEHQQPQTIIDTAVCAGFLLLPGRVKPVGMGSRETDRSAGTGTHAGSSVFLTGSALKPMICLSLVENVSCSCVTSGLNRSVGDIGQCRECLLSLTFISERLSHRWHSKTQHPKTFVLVVWQSGQDTESLLHQSLNRGLPAKLLKCHCVKQGMCVKHGTSF